MRSERAWYREMYMAEMDEHDWPPLTDEDRRRIAEIRRQLDRELDAFDAKPARRRRGWRRPLALAAVVGAALSGSVLSVALVRHAPWPGPTAQPPAVSVQAPAVRPAPIEDSPRHAVHGALDAWLEATRRGDIPAQMTFYPDVVPVFYTWRNVPTAAVLGEKRKVFAGAWTLHIRTGPPDIDVAPDQGSAVTRFRKAYVIAGPRVRRRGEVLQELRWARTDAGWKITSERDAAVLARD